MLKSIAVSLVLTLASTVLAPAAAFAQDKPKDEALDKFLQKLDGTKTPDTPREGAKDDRETSAAKGKPGDSTTKGKDDVAPSDKELDNFLEKLGETKETPAADDRGPGLPKPRPEPPTEPGKSKRPELKGEAGELDKHLEELTGRRRKRKNDEDGEGSGPFGKIVKEMREVEQRLGKPDTGDETRKKQTEIVKQLDKVIDELKNMSSSQARRRMQLAMKPGQKSGQQRGDQPGNNSGNAPYTKPEKPNNRRSTAMGKEEWGHLPPELRQEIDNIFNEQALTKRQNLIDRYFDSLSKKALVRRE